MLSFYRIKLNFPLCDVCLKYILNNVEIIKLLTFQFLDNSAMWH